MVRVLNSTDALILASLFVLAAVAPGPLYLLALSLFGLPHVLWELRWLQLAGQGVFPRRLVMGLALCLSLVVVGRVLVLGGGTWASCSPWLDALALMAALLLMWPRVPARRRPLALIMFAAFAACLISNNLWALIALLMLFSVVHNATPLALLRWRVPAGDRVHGWFQALYLLPFLLLISGAAGWSTDARNLLGQAMSLPEAWQPVEARWLMLQGVAGGWLHGALSALVFLQCLHYLAVLRWLPRTLPGGVMSWPGRISQSMVWFSCVVMTLAFASSFIDARLVYAIAAGVHAWLEWPLLLAYRHPDTAVIASDLNRSVT